MEGTDTNDMADWNPQPKQCQALIRKDFEILYGGSRGGGKTEAGIVWLTYPEYRNHPHYRGLTIRKNADDLKDWVDRAQAMYKRLGGKRVGSPPEFRFPSGAKIRTGHLNDEDAYEKYQGHEYQRMLIEELTQIPTEIRYLSLLSSCRSTIDGLPAQTFCTANPGGPGHQWVKSRFVSCGPPNVSFIDPSSGRSRIFIPATIEDNPTLIAKDPDYIRFLDSLPPGLKEAWRYGSWDFVVGAAFSELSREVHGIDPANPPERLLKLFDFEKMIPIGDAKVFRTYDWGYAKPASVGYWFTDYDNRLYRWAEIYFKKGPNEGLQKTTREQGQIMRKFEAERNLKISLAIADASIWSKPNNTQEKAGKLASDAEILAEERIFFDHELSKEVHKPGSRISGVGQMHDRLRVDADGLPSIFVFNTCVDWWRTVPVVPVDDLDPEDVDTDSEDHTWDDTKMLLLARPMKARVKVNAPPPMSLKWIEQNYMRPLNG